ncbi:MAG: TonB family protein [Acidobacteriota bacterium]
MKNQGQRLVCSFVSAQVIRFSVALALTLVLMLCARFVGGRAFGQTQPARGEPTARPDNINYDAVKAMTLQPDGKVIVAGFTRGKSTNPVAASGNGADGRKTPRNSKGDFALARYLADGSPDTSFGEGGKVVTDFAGNDDRVNAVALQADGKILLVGITGWDDCDSDFALARYNSDGTLDASFGRGGKVVTDFFGKYDEALAVAIERDGGIVVAGRAWSDRSNLAVARYTRRGSLDPAFGNAGKAVTPSTRTVDACSISLQDDGKILIAGGSSDCSAVGGTVSFRSFFELTRYHADGRTDTAFGDKGTLTTTVKPPEGIPSAIAIQSDGKVIVASKTNMEGRSGYFLLRRFDKNGLPDDSFGNGGTAVTRFENTTIPGAIALLPNGGFIVVGSAYLTGSPQAFALARYAKNGELNLSFRRAGKVIAPGGGYGEASAIAVQPDGKIIAGGYVETRRDLADFLLMRYNEDGTLDTAFGSGGKVIADFNGITDKTPALDFKQNPQSVARKPNCTKSMVVATITVEPGPATPREEAGTGRGVGPGRAGNLGGGSTSKPPTPGAPASAVDSKPVLLSNPPPRYTEEARANKIQGVVTARLLVGADGQVKRVTIVRGLPDGLDDQAIQAAFQYRYKPALKDGKPVTYLVVVQIEFNLR